MVTEFSKLTGVPELEILGKRGIQRVNDVRQLYWRCLHLNGYSYADIARLCKNNHATIISGITRINNLLEKKDPSIIFLNQLTKNIKRYEYKK